MKVDIGGDKMFLNKPYGYWSVLLSIVGSLFLVTPYFISPSDPQGMIVISMKIMLVVAIFLLTLGIVASILAIKKKEVGVKKYFGILLPILIILFVILIPILMGIGFMLNDNP